MLPHHKLTLSEVSGQGLCIGTVPATHEPLCNNTILPSPGNYYLTPPNGTYWACSTGLTPCVAVQILNLTSDYCVLIELWPKVTYLDPEYVYSYFEGRTKFKREPVSLTLALLMGGLTVGGIAAGVGTGASALAATQQFRQLQMAMHVEEYGWGTTRAWCWPSLQWLWHGWRGTRAERYAQAKIHFVAGEGFPPRLCGTSGFGTSDNWFKRESEPTLGCGYDPEVRRHHF